MTVLDFTNIDFSIYDPKDYLYKPNFDFSQKKRGRRSLYHLTMDFLDENVYYEVLENQICVSDEKKIVIPFVKHCSVLGLIDENRRVSVGHITKGFSQKFFLEELLKDNIPDKIFSIGNINGNLLGKLNSSSIPYLDLRTSNKFSKDIIITPKQKEILVIMDEENYFKKYI